MTMNCTLDEYIVSGFENDLKKESERITYSWMRKASIFEHENDRQRYLKFQRQELARLTGMLLEYSDSQDHSALPQNPGILYQSLLKMLNELSAFIKDQFHQVVIN